MVFVSYFVVLIGISVYAYYKRKKAKNFSEEYYVAGRSFGPWIVALCGLLHGTSGGTFYRNTGSLIIPWDGRPSLAGRRQAFSE